MCQAQARFVVIICVVPENIHIPLPLGISINLPLSVGMDIFWKYTTAQARLFCHLAH